MVAPGGGKIFQEPAVEFYGFLRRVYAKQSCNRAGRPEHFGHSRQVFRHACYFTLGHGELVGYVGFVPHNKPLEGEAVVVGAPNNLVFAYAAEFTIHGLVQFRTKHQRRLHVPGGSYPAGVLFWCPVGRVGNGQSEGLVGQGLHIIHAIAVEHFTSGHSRQFFQTCGGGL